MKKEDRKENHGPSKEEAKEMRLELLAEMTEKLQLILQRLSDPNMLDTGKKETYRNMAESIQRQIASLKPAESKKQRRAERRAERRRRQEKRSKGYEYQKPETTTSQEDPKDEGREKPWVAESLMDSGSSEDSEAPPKKARARVAPSCAPHLRGIAPSSAPAVRKPLPRPKSEEATNFRDSGLQPAERGFVADSVTSW
ncbi:unnamed protein product [Symbiodinium sp. CCMP2592]|nr:unnamed protein product [Symbiodinium sp. CCMP2592]